MVERGPDPQCDLLFIATVDDLQRRVQQPTGTYDVLMSAGLLRKLLVDDRRSLLHQVNRSRRREVRFQVNVGDVPSEGSDLLAWSVQDAIDPELPRPPGRVILQDLPLNRFLKQRIAYTQPLSVNVEDVIKHAANVAGAVHYGQPKTEIDVALANDPISLMGMNPHIRSLMPLGRIVVRALTPLAQEIRQESRHIGL